MTPSRRSGLWTWVIALLVAAQFGLLIHQSQHHLNPAVRTSDDCTLCQFAQAMAAAPAGPIVVLPVLVLLGTVIFEPRTAPRDARIALPFRSRAPPGSIRI